MAGIELATARLDLRQPKADDFASSHTLTESDEMRRFLGREPPSREDSFNRLLRNAGSWGLFGHGIFVVIERETGAHVGGCGLFRGQRGLGDDFDPYPEAGWIVAQDRWGRGYASEAMEAALAWFDEAFGGRTVCMIEPGNTGSERIAAKLGYRPIGTARYKDDEVMRYARAHSSRHPSAGWGPSE